VAAGNILTCTQAVSSCTAARGSPPDWSRASVAPASSAKAAGSSGMAGGASSPGSASQVLELRDVSPSAAEMGAASWPDISTARRAGGALPPSRVRAG
jgi:hypothetical protein